MKINGFTCPFFEIHVFADIFSQSAIQYRKEGAFQVIIVLAFNIMPCKHFFRTKNSGVYKGNQPVQIGQRGLKWSSRQQNLRYALSTVIQAFCAFCPMKYISEIMGFIDDDKIPFHIGKPLHQLGRIVIGCYDYLRFFVVFKPCFIS